MSLIVLHDIRKTYGKGQAALKALNGVSLAVAKGEMVAIMGRSGSGKSTLLNILGGLDGMSAGRYVFNGRELDFKRQNELAAFRNQYIGFIMQHFALIDEMTVYENVALPLRYRGLTPGRIEKKVMTMLGNLEISDKRHSYPGELSGGQCQRVAIARALINDPEVILADEPTGSLDGTTEKVILDIFRELNQAGKTIILVTHDPEVAALSRRIVRLHDGQILAG